METKIQIAERILKERITFKQNIQNGNYSCVGIPYSDALGAVVQALKENEEENKKLKEGLREIENADAIDGYFYNIVKKTLNNK